MKSTLKSRDFPIKMRKNLREEIDVSKKIAKNIKKLHDAMKFATNAYHKEMKSTLKFKTPQSKCADL